MALARPESSSAAKDARRDASSPGHRRATPRPYTRVKKRIASCFRRGRATASCGHFEVAASGDYGHLTTSRRTSADPCEARSGHTATQQRSFIGASPLATVTTRVRGAAKHASRSRNARQSVVHASALV